MDGKDENIYVYLTAKSNYYGQVFEYGGFYTIEKTATMDYIVGLVTSDMNECFEKQLGGLDRLPTANIVSINDVSKELYERLHRAD